MAFEVFRMWSTQRNRWWMVIRMNAILKWKIDLWYLLFMHDIQLHWNDTLLLHLIVLSANIYKLAMDRNFVVALKKNLRLNWPSLSLCVGFYYTISFLVLWLSWCVCLIYHRNARTNIYSIQLFGTWIDSGMYLTQHRCTYVRWQVLYTQNTRTALLFISAETMYGKRTLELKVCERQTQCCTMIAFVLFQCICTFRARWCAIVIISGGTAYWLIKPWIALISNLSFWTDLLLNTLQHHLFICNVNTLNTA